MAFFKMPPDASADVAGSLNDFLRSHKVMTVTRQWMEAGEASGWAFCVEYVEGGAALKTNGQATAKVDYREVLPAEQFEVFARLRSLRKTLSERDGIPLFAIFTNEQLAEIARRGCGTLAELREITGLGEARVGKYGADVLALLQPAA